MSDATAPIASFTKDPDAILDYEIDWSRWLASGDQLSSSEWSSSSEALTIDSSDYSTKASKCWLSGGIAGESYLVRCRVVTTQGRRDDRTIRVTCAER